MRLIIYGGMTMAWILLTAFGFAVVTRFSSIMLIGFLLGIGLDGVCRRRAVGRGCGQRR